MPHRPHSSQDAASGAVLAHNHRTVDHDGTPLLSGQRVGTEHTSAPRSVSTVGATANSTNLTETTALLSVQSGGATNANPLIPLAPLEPPPARWRTTVVGLLWLCNVSLYLSRANISIAALYMFEDCLQWQKWVFAAFFFGYTCSQIPAGYSAGRVGGKAVLVTGVAVWSLATFVCVPAFRWAPDAPWPLVVCRVVIGFAEGCNYPSQVALVGKWVPEHERTTAWNALTVGEAGGTIVAMLSSPWLAAHGGWPLIFYTSGGLGVLWLILFTLLVTETPETHPWISHAERDYIVGARQRAVGRTIAPPSFCEVPWRGFVRHRPFWATVCAHACYNYMSFLALSLGPYFFKTKYNVDISSPKSGLGVYACLPYVVLFVAQAVAGVVADGLRGNGMFTLTAIRKGFNTAGLLVATSGFAVLASPALQHGGTGTTGLHTALAVLTVAVGVGGIAITGHWANYRDLSSTYSPHLLAIGTSIATIPGMVTNLVSGTLLDRIDRDPASTAEAWSHVFAITAGVSLIGALVFLVFGSATQVNFDK